MGCDLRRHRRLGRLESISAPAWLLGPAVVVALALTFAAWLVLHDAPATVTWLDIGSPGDESHITGAFPPERNATESYRWTTSSAIVTVPAPPGHSYQLDVAIASVGNDPRTLQVTCPGGAASAQLGAGVTPPSVPIECRSDGEIPVTFSVPEIRVEGDGRPLGVAVLDIRVTALDREPIAVWRLWCGLSAALATVGFWLAISSVANRSIATIATVPTVLATLAIGARRPDWLLAIVTGPFAVIALAAGYAAWLLATKRRSGPFALGLIALMVWLFERPPDPALVLPALWTPHDSTGYDLLPGLASLTIIAASIIGGRHARLLAGFAALVAVGSMLAIVVARQVLLHWSLVIDGPDWTDVASPIGAILLLATAVTVVVAFGALATSTVSPRLGMVIVVIVTLSILVPWRNAVMNLNGDEPHYYVTAHSLVADADLELLDDYLEPDYLDATISPTGNIAVARAIHPDRYVSLSPAIRDTWFLIPDRSSGLTADADSGLIRATGTSPTVVDGDGNRDGLPPLQPSNALWIPASGPCAIDSIVLASPDGSPATATVRLLDATGEQRWQESVAINREPVELQSPLALSTCTADFAGAFAIEAVRPLVAEAIDTASGLRILPAHPSSGEWLLGPLPRDRYATQSATARLALHNPASDSVAVTVRLATPSEELLRATDVTVGPNQTVTLDLDLHAAVAVSISASAPVVAGATGWLPGGSYAVPSMPDVDTWRFDIPPAADRDAGIWLALANRSADPREVSIDDRSVESLVICPNCAEMLLFPSGDRSRTVSVTAANGTVAVSAVAYEERTGALHFDLGLPLLAALPIRIAGPDAAPVISSIAALFLALGLFDLLRRIGVTDRQAAVAAGAVVLLAPLSPYAVRLYTEPLAGCLVVWSLVCWDRARVRPVFALVALFLAATLPLIHGRYTPLAFALGVVTVLMMARRVDISRRQMIGIIALVVVLFLAIAFSPLAIALRDRASGGYFSTEWVPRNLLGILLDRGSGLLPFAPWCLLAFAAPRRLYPLQRTALALIVVQISVVALRAGGWQTFGAPARYILPVVPLIALFAVPGALRLWSGAWRLLVIIALVWSAGTTVLLHWLPLTGYVSAGRYFVDVARRELPPLVVVDAFPTVSPAVGSNLLGIMLLLAIWTGAWIGIKYRNS